MIGAFSFNLSADFRGFPSALIIYVSQASDAGEVMRLLKRHVGEMLPPANVIMVSAYKNKAMLEEFLSNSAMLSEFNALTDAFSKFLGLYFDGKGSILNLDGSASAAGIGGEILKCGFFDIFRRRKGIIESTDSYHFVKPSDQHCNSFIRASNTLVAGVEVEFLANGILPLMSPTLRRLYVDTSSISHLMQTVVRMHVDLSKTEVLIDSFESYAGLTGGYDFVVDSDSMVFLSASTSNNMSNILTSDFGFGLHQVVTLYGLKDKNSVVVYDMSSIIPKNFKSVSGDNCEFCKKESRQVYISGEQFLPETPRSEPVVIRKKDFSIERERFFEEFATKNVLGWNSYSSGVLDDGDHFHISLNEAMAQNGFREDFYRATGRLLSVNTKNLISLNDSDSILLRDKILLKYNDIGLKIAVFDGNIDGDFDGDHSVLVVAGAITSGRKLLSVSRALREIKKECSISYLVGFSKISSAEMLLQIKKDLEQGGNRFEVLRRCPMPRVKEHHMTAWNSEAIFLKRQSKNNPFLAGPELPTSFENRLDSFNNVSIGCDDIFLPSPSGSKLELRSTFAFWSDLNLVSKSASQSDVYWTIQSVLHDLRSSKIGSGLSSIYHSNFISPVCFDRYNDGVIQACILRSCSPAEISYRFDLDASRLMADVIISIVSNWDKPQGEAASEFLLAICCERMLLCDLHVSEIKNCLTSSMPSELKFLIAMLPGL